jgi:hypothetical protein
MIERLRPHRFSRPAGDQGVALAEVVISIAIIGLSMTILVGSFATGVRSTGRHRDLSYANIAASIIAEWVSGEPYSTTGTYSVPSTTDVSYPPGWEPSDVILTTTCWVLGSDPPTFGACSTDTRLQLIEIDLDDGTTRRSVEVLKRHRL